jgi:hypothetical protein
MINLKANSKIFFSLLTLISCNSFAAVQLTENNFAGEWPFTIESGVLDCKDASITLEYHDIKYAINGIAKAKGFAEVDSIWKDDPAFYELAKAIKKSDESIEDVITQMGGPTKINIGPIIQLGLKLCK